FFSSRRRHTRLVSDWTSDVCSSDLKTEQNRIWGRIAVLARQPASTLGVVASPGRQKDMRDGEPRSPEGVVDCNAEIFLAGVQVLRPDPSTTAPLRGCHNHAVIEVHTVRRANSHGTPDDVAVGA